MNKLKNIIGTCMIISVFIGLFIYCGLTIGFHIAFKAFGIAILITKFVIIGVSLMVCEE